MKQFFQSGSKFKELCSLEQCQIGKFAECAGDLSYVQIACAAVFVSLNNSSIVFFCCFTKISRLEPRLKFKVRGREIGRARQTFQSGNNEQIKVNSLKICCVTICPSSHATFFHYHSLFFLYLVSNFPMLKQENGSYIHGAADITDFLIQNVCGTVYSFSLLLGHHFICYWDTILYDFMQQYFNYCFRNMDNPQSNFTEKEV